MQGTQWNSVLPQVEGAACACSKKIEAQGHLKGTEDIDSASGVWAGTISMTQRVTHTSVIE